LKDRVSITGNEITYVLSGELDHHSARLARESIDSLIQQKKPSVLRLDFSEVGFMDSSGIGLIMGRYRMTHLYGGTLKVVNIPEELERIMTLSGLKVLGVIEQKGEVYENAE